MFEPIIRSMDAMHGIWVGAHAGSTNVGATMAQQGAKEGEEYAGPVGGMMGGALGWAYGSVVGLWMGALQGSILGAKHYMTDEPPAASSHPRSPKVT